MMPRPAAFLGGVLLLGSAALAQASTSSEQNPVHAFSTPGAHQVTLTSCNAGGCSTVTKTVTVLDPAPSVVWASVGAATAEAGQLVSLSGSGKGKPPLVYAWRVMQGATLVREVPGAMGWLDTTGLAPGAYTVLLRITNASGQADSTPAPLTVLQAAATDFYTLTPCRVFDSRTGTPLHSGGARLVSVAGLCEIPAGARALAVNITTVSATNPGSLVAFPGNYPVPGVDTAFFKPGYAMTNNVILPLSTDGAATLALQPTGVGGGTVHVAVDVFGYFLP